MCVRLKRNSKGRISGFELDYKATVGTMAGLMVVFSFFSMVKINCNSSGTFAKEHLIRPVAESTFVQMHKPFEDKLDKLCYDTKLIRMIETATTADTIVQACIKAMKDSTWKVQ